MKMNINEGISNDDLWTPYKELQTVVESYIAQDGDTSYSIQAFESALRRHKHMFLTLMKNLTKNNVCREEIKKGITDGVVLPSIGKTLLSKDLIDEAIIISDMYNVNEYLALELLHTAQRQSTRHPGLPRGLIAVLLYYDGRKAIVTALKELMMTHVGVSWCTSAREDIVKYVTRYMSGLINDGLLERVMDTIKTMELSAELELLHNNRAIGGPKHYRNVVDCFETIRKQLAGVMFAASAQRGLSSDMLLRVYRHLYQTPSTPGASGTIDDVTLTLHMSLLYATDLSILHRRDDGEELAKKLPLISDANLISTLISELNNQQSEATPAQHGVRALTQLSLGLALSALKRAPQSLLRGEGQAFSNELLDQDEMLVDSAIEGRVFEYIHTVLLSCELLHKEEYYVKRIHSLITDFIVLQHSKLMEMRLKADEVARAVQMYAAEGLNPPVNNNEHQSGQFEALLVCIEMLYKDEKYGLKQEYWSAADQQHTHAYRSGGRAATLYKLVRLSGELVGARLVPAYVRCVASLATAPHTYALLARSDMAPASPLSWDHIFTAMYNYYCNLRQEVLVLPEQHHIYSMGASAITTHVNRAKMLVREDEVEALIAALKLIQSVAQVDSHAAVAICDTIRWDAVNCMFGLLGCHIPLSVKAEITLVLATLGSGPCAMKIWAGLEAAKLIPSSERNTPGLHADLNEVESRQEEYPLTRAVLTLLYSLSSNAPLPCTLGAGTRPAGLDPYLNYVLKYVTLPANNRPYANPAEKWQVLSLALKLISLWLEQYEPNSSDFQLVNKSSEMNPPPGLHLMLHLHTRSELLRLILQLLNDIVEVLQQYRPVAGKEYMKSTLVYCLNILEVALVNEKRLIHEATQVGYNVPITGLSKLLLGSDVAQGVEPLLTACRVLLHVTEVPLAANKSLALLDVALQYPPAQTHLLAVINATHKNRIEIRHGFVECCEWAEAGESRVLAVKVSRRAAALAHYLCGLRQDTFTTHGGSQLAQDVRTLLHSVIDVLDQALSSSEANTLTEECYSLLYWLCSRQQSAQPVIRMLRSRDDFLLRHLQSIVPLENATMTTISARSWCIRAAACQLAASTHTPTPLAPLARALTQYQEWEWALIRRLITGLPMEVEPVDEPKWELLHAPQLMKAINLCDLPIGGGGKRISVSKVHAALLQELAALNATAPQRNLISAEIQKVLDYCTEINKQRNLASTLSHYYDSWRQLTEILFCVAPVYATNAETIRSLILNILQELLEKIAPERVIPQLASLASGTILLLLVNLRHCYLIQKRDSEKVNKSASTLFDSTTCSVHSSMLALKFTLDKIINWLLIPGGTTQKMRINLYGGLLNILNIANGKVFSFESKDSNYVSRLDSSICKVQRMDISLLDVISSRSFELCSTLCSDCIEGSHTLCRMVALCCIDALLDIQPNGKWPQALADRGYLKNLIDSLLHDDEELRQVLEPSPKSMKALYIYESKMTLLTKIASTRAGAEMILEQSALSCLANLKALDCRPDTSATLGTEFIPPAADRFRQLIVPAFALCDTLLTTLGTENHSLIVHITHFLLSHLETIDMILRAAHPHSTYTSLIEIEAVTSVISRSANRDILRSVQLVDSTAGLHRIEALVMALLPRFSSINNVTHDENKLHIYYKIVCNILTYVRHLTSASFGRALLRPTLAPQNAATLGALIQVLQTLVRGCQDRWKAYNTLQAQLRAVPSMTHQELKTMLPQSQDWSPIEAHHTVMESLNHRLSLRRRERAHAVYGVESALHIVWIHLDFYMRRTVPDILESTYSLTDVNTSHSLMPINASHKANVPDLIEMKKGLVSIFNDKFAGELIEIGQSQSPAQQGFLDVLLRDVKCLIQFAPL